MTSIKKSEWTMELRTLEKKARDFLGRRIPVKSVPEDSKELGYTSGKPEIYIAPNHEIMEGLSKERKKFFRMGVFAHEMLHQIFSDFDILRKTSETFETGAEAKIYGSLFNLVEDAFIEYFAPTVMGGTLLKSLRYTIRRIYQKTPPLSEGMPPLSQYMAALIMLGDMGVVKGHFTDETAAKCFVKSAPVFNRGVESSLAKDRSDVAIELLNLSRPLWEETAKNEKIMKELMDSLKESGLLKGLETISSGSGSGEKDSESSSGEGKPATEAPALSSAGKKRRAMVKKLAKMADETDSSEEKSESDSSDKEEGKEPSEEKDSPSEKKSPILDELSSLCEEKEFVSEDDSIDLSESDCTWLEEAEKSAEREMEAEKKKPVSDGEIDESICSDDKAKSIYTLKNYDMAVNDASLLYYEAQYASFLSHYGNGIKAFSKKLSRLFRNDTDEKEYKRSGKINVNRYYSSRVTSRVFDKRTSPKNIADIAVFVLIDESGSMILNGRITTSQNIAMSLAETFAILDIPSYFMGFSGEVSADVEHYHYIKWKNTKRARLSLLGIKDRLQNFDSYSINCAFQILKKKRANHKILIVISDGVPYCSYEKYEKGVACVKEEIRKIRKTGADVLGIAVGDSDTKELQSMYGKNFFHAGTAEDAFLGVAKEFQNIVKSW